MRRFFSIFTLLIAAFWLTGGVSMEMDGGGLSERASVSPTSVIRSRLKMVKVPALTRESGRTAVTVPLGLGPREEPVVRNSVRRTTRGALLAGHPRPVAEIPPAPSLTGQVVLVV